MNLTPLASDVRLLEEAYRERVAFHGELHDHADTGGSSDGHHTLLEWTGFLAELEMDFAALVDHRQVRHMYLPEWDDAVFIGGTEAASSILDCNAEKKSFHYNMIFSSPAPLEELLEEFPEYEFSGGAEGHFRYGGFPRARFLEIVEAVKEKGGFFAHVHPKQLMNSADPLDYWFGDETGLEVFYANMENDDTKANYELWLKLLSLGKRVWATAGFDGHRKASVNALSTVYSKNKSAEHFLSHLRRGDLTCGGVGVRMCLGDAVSGGRENFKGERLVFSVGDFHKSLRFPDHEYDAVLFDEKGEVCRERISCDTASYFALDADENALFYRVEVHDTAKGRPIIALGNPIWNESEIKKEKKE